MAKSGEGFGLVLWLSQHLRDTQLLQSFIDYLKCGRVKQRKGKESVEYLVTRLSDITDKIIPLFEKYPKESPYQR